jgi:hypothetical protein
MSKLILEKDNNGMRVTLMHATPSITPDDAPDSRDFKIRFETGEGNDAVIVTLTASALQTMGLQCAALMPAIFPAFTVASVEEAYRIPVRVMRELGDRSIQTLLRECQSETLIDFLWYMKDGALMKQVLRNMSQRAAEMLMADIDERWRGKNPDTALEANAKRGREAVLEIMEIMRRLIAEKQIENVFGDPQ